MTTASSRRLPHRRRRRQGAARRRPAGPDGRHRSGCRPSGSTTPAAASCSRRSPGSPEYYPTRAEREILAAPRRRDRLAQRRAHPGRARLRLLGEDPAAARRAARARHAAAVRAARRLRVRAARGRRGHRRATTPASPSTAWSATSPSTSSRTPGEAPAPGRVPRRHDRQPLPARAGHVPHRGSRGAGARRVAAAGHRPGQGRRDPRPRVRRPAGVTAAFNRNVLTVLNRELGADFPVEDFEHHAVWDAEHEWIEMRLRATRALSVRVEDLDLQLSLRGGRGDPHRDLREVPARGRRGRAVDRRLRPRRVVDRRAGPLRALPGPRGLTAAPPTPRKAVPPRRMPESSGHDRRAPSSRGGWGSSVECLSGGVLLSHTVPSAVPSALKGLASGFGMEPGVSPSL